jgi:hypothetical protein
MISNFRGQKNFCQDLHEVSAVQDRKVAIKTPYSGQNFELDGAQEYIGVQSRRTPTVPSWSTLLIS